MRKSVPTLLKNKFQGLKIEVEEQAQGLKIEG